MVGKHRNGPTYVHSKKKPLQSRKKTQLKTIRTLLIIIAAFYFEFGILFNFHIP